LECRALLSFAPAVDYAVGDMPRSVIVGDFRGDGHLDLAVANIGSDTVSVLLGNGDGTFQDAVDYPVGSQPHFVVAGDFDGDGITDLVVSVSAGGFLAFLKGNGDGTFQPPVYTGVPEVWPHRMVVRDFDGDGVPDIAVVNTFSDSLSIYLGNGDGTFRLCATYAVNQAPVGLAAGYFRGDGRLDLAVANYDFFNEGGGNVEVFLGNGDGTFQPGDTYALGADTWSVAVGDFNGDGQDDLAVPQSDKGVAILLGNGDGTFQPPAFYAAGGYPDDVAVADLNHDGRLDLVVTNFASGDVSILWGNGDGSFQPPENYPTGSGPFNAAVADFNNDGLPDLAVANYGDATVSILLGTSDDPRGAPPRVMAGRGPANDSPAFTRLNPADWPVLRPEIRTASEPVPHATNRAARPASRPDPGQCTAENIPTPAANLPAGPLSRVNRAGQAALPDLDDWPAAGGIEVGQAGKPDIRLERLTYTVFVRQLLQRRTQA
jgi:hypothetical protein